MKFFSGQKLKWNFIIPIFLWLLIWAGYNADYGKLHSSNLLNFFHGIRAFFPILAGVLAFILLIKRHFFSQKILKTPLGFLIIYTLIGIISSIFLSAKPLIALYWSFSYFSVLAVLFLTLTDSNSIPSLINLNWIIVFFITIGLFLFFLFQPGAISSLTRFFGGRPYEGLAGIPAEKQILGMAGTRPTGLGRYAGVIALVALAKLLSDKRKLKLNWFFFFLFSYFILLFTEARTAILGFVFASFLIFLLNSQSKTAIFSWSSFTLLHLVLVGIFLFYIPYFSEKIVIPQPTVVTLTPPAPTPPAPTPPAPTPPAPQPQIFVPQPGSKTATETILFTLSGRTTGVWPQAWKLFLKSPLIGFGFHADRIFLEGQHAHNAILHALIQTGVIGTIPFIIAFVWAWIILFKLLKKPIPEKPFLIEIAAIFAFFTIRGITESTGAFFGVDWILLAPLLAYLQFLNQKNYGQKSNSINSNFRK